MLQTSSLTLPKLPLTNQHTILAKKDSGASQHYFNLQDANSLQHVHVDPNGPTVKLPNNQQITASHTGFLPFSKHLRKSATKTSLFNNLSNNLISIGQLCDDGCEVLFTQSHMQVTKNKNMISRHMHSKGAKKLFYKIFLYEE